MSHSPPEANDPIHDGLPLSAWLERLAARFDQDAAKAIEELVSRDGRVPQQILRHARIDAVLSNLCSGLGSNNSFNQKAAVWALSRLDSSVTAARLVEELPRCNPVILSRLGVLRRLWLLRDLPTYHLREMLNEADSPTACKAARALGLLQAEEALPSLVAELYSTRNRGEPGFRRAVAEALGEAGHAASISWCESTIVIVGGYCPFSPERL